MHKEREHEKHKGDHAAEAYRGYDPVQASWSQSGIFNRAWLKNGERLTPLQRSGYAVLSLLFVAFGLYFLRFCVNCLEDGDWIFMLIFGGITLLFLLPGIKGLQNVLRFPQRS